MRKILSLTIIALLTVNIAISQISSSEAEIIARKCLILKSPESDIKLHFEKAKVSSVYTETENNEALWHVVNFEPKGFVIVSADTLYHPIIAFSWRTNFEFPMPESGVKMWMQNQKNQLTKVKSRQLETPRVKNEWDMYLNSDVNTLKNKQQRIVTPLLSTQWNQSIYYNEHCPKDPAGPDGKTLAGCVATAIGQLMNYYRYPLSGTGSYTSQYTVYGTQTINYSQANYKWSEMGTKLTRSNPAIAELLYHIGVSVDMHYGPNGSGMWNHKAAHTMKTYFGYVNDTEYMFRDTVTANWYGIIIDHIDRGEPLYYAGWTDNQYVSGHAFVADGYQDSTFFHFNWGWGGSFDGYFNIDNLIVGGSDFTTMHEAVVNMFPASNYPYYCGGTQILSSLDGLIDDGSGPLFDYQNNQNCSWLIAPFDTISSIVLEFLKFDLKPNDLLKVYRGQDASGTLLATYSSTNLPPSNLTVAGNKAYINFTSDNNDNGEGFLISYKANQVRTCSGLKTLTAPSGTITDGSGIYNYQNLNNCRWRLEVPNAVMYAINFTKFDIDSTDYVRIQDLSNGSIIATLTGNQIPDPVFVYSDKIIVNFISGATENSNGFELNYNTYFQNIDIADIKNLTVYPIPAQETIYLQLNNNNNAIRQIEIINILGQNVLSIENALNQEILNINISGIENGLYIVRALLTNGDELSTRFIKN